MRPVLKFSLSLLIAVILFSVFAFLAFSGLFEILETTFYSPRVLAQYTYTLEETARNIESFQREQLTRLEAIVSNESMRTVYRANQSQADIQAREGLVSRLRAEQSGFEYLLFLDNEGTRLHFSSRSDDFTGTGAQRTYRPLEELDEQETLIDLVLDGDSTSEYVLLPDKNLFVYRIPAFGTEGIQRGFGLFFYNPRSLSTRLISAGMMRTGTSVQILRDDLLLVGVPAGDAERIVPQLDEIIDSETDRVLRLRTTDDVDVLAPSVRVGDMRFVTLASAQEFEIGFPLQVIILSGVFLTVFLVVFLILNLKQDSTVVLSERIKRLQISLLKEYVENRDEINFERWESDLRARKPEVVKRIRKGVGRVRKAEKEEFDRLADKGWDEIVDLLSRRAASHTEGTLDIARIERMMERVLQNLPPGTVGVAPAQGTNMSHPPALPGVDTADSGSETTEQDAEPSETEQPGELESVGELEEMEELDELDDVEDLSEAEEAEELSEIEEAEDIDEAEYLGDADEPEDLVELDADDGLEDAGEATELEEAEALEDAEEIEEVEELAELEAEEAPEEVTELGADDGLEEIAEATELEEAEELEELTELDAADDLVELDEVSNDDVDELIPVAESPVAQPLFFSGQTTTASSPVWEFTQTSLEQEIEAITNAELRDLDPGAVESEGGRTRLTELRDCEIIDHNAFMGLLGASSVIEEAEGVFRIDTSVFERTSSTVRGTSERTETKQPQAREELWNDDDLILLGPSTITPARRASSPGELRLAEGVEGRTEPTVAPERTSTVSTQEQNAIIRACLFGLDYDRYLEGFRPDDGGVMRSLVYFTRSANARSALLAVLSDESFDVSYQLGVDESCDGLMSIASQSELGEEVLRTGSALYADVALSDIPGFQFRCDSEHLGSFRPVVFLPVGFRGTAAYLIMSMYPDSGSIEDIISRLRTNAHHPQDR
ncbi:MAG: hypothetical protein EA383_09635 [Spirochaetaceae bacterium]|nr:MAG: hypothetical protein EA383_09635 [Spirochaetaceae bacterium]